MARWEPGARERLVVAAVELFTEHGYDATTVAQIAERAGVSSSCAGLRGVKSAHATGLLAQLVQLGRWNGTVVMTMPS